MSNPLDEQGARAILDSAHEAFVGIDSDGRITDWNAEAERTFGWSAADAVGRPMSETIVPDEYRKAHRRGLARFLATGKAQVLGQRLELSALHREGHTFPVEMTITASRNGDHRFHAFLHDISARKQAEQYAAAQYAVARVLADCETVNEAIPGLLNALGRSMEWDCAGAWALDEEAGTLRCVRFWRADPKRHRDFERASRELELEPGEGLPGRVWKAGEAERIADVRQDPNFPRAEAAAQAELNGAICLPLSIGGQRLRVFEFFCADSRRIDQDLLDFVVSIGSQAGRFLAILNERSGLVDRLSRLARTDELTGLPNRRAWEEELTRECARADRQGRSLCVALADLDHFKAFNDEHGHAAGDDVLRRTAAAWSSMLRADDLVARVGGEEFALALPGADPRVAHTICDRLRRATAEDITCSVGLARWDGRESLRDLMERADAALYEAKRSGRDRTVSGA